MKTKELKNELEAFLIKDANLLELWLIFKACNIKMGDLHRIISQTVEPILSSLNDSDQDEKELEKKLNSILTPCGRELLTSWVEEATINRSRAREKKGRLKVLEYNHKKIDEIYCKLFELRKDILSMDEKEILKKWFAKKITVYKEIKLKLLSKKTEKVFSRTIEKIEDIIKTLNREFNNFDTDPLLIEEIAKVLPKKTKLLLNLKEQLEKFFETFLKEYQYQEKTKAETKTEKNKKLEVEAERKIYDSQRKSLFYFKKQFKLYQKAINLLKFSYQEQV